METSKTQEESMMKAEPQKEHKWLHKLIGEWTYEGNATMEPGKPSAKLEGVESVCSLGDIWIVAEGKKGVLKMERIPIHRRIFLLSFSILAVLSSTTEAESASFQAFLESAIQFDGEGETITLPLYQGMFDETVVWYIITESSERDDAEQRGVNWASRLANVVNTTAVQEVTMVNEMVQFAGMVDFTPVHAVAPGPMVFPPSVADPGSLGDALYSPLITLGNGIVLNAPQVANITGMHDKVVAIDFMARTVTLSLTAGFYHGKAILYLATDASDPVAATLEGSTFTPSLNAAPGLGSPDKDELSARASIVVIINGDIGLGNPERQGIVSAILGEGSPLNITRRHPGAEEYSPLWDVHPAVWTDPAIAAGQRMLFDHHADVADAVRDGRLASGGSGPTNPDLGGLRAAGFIVNCPIMAME